MFFVETVTVVLAKMSINIALYLARNLTLFLGSAAPFGGLAIVIFFTFRFVALGLYFLSENKIANITHYFSQSGNFCSILVILINNSVHSKSLTFSRSDEV
jgi:hypothetical protein